MVKQEGVDELFEVRHFGQAQRSLWIS